MTMPNFLVIGAGKCGSTALYHYLKQHPQIYMSPTKEPHFFEFEAGIPTYGGPIQSPRHVRGIETYLKLFDGVVHETAIGEASMSNFSPVSCARIQHYMPKGRFICLLRQPVDRAYSQFNHTRREGWEPIENFYEAYRASALRRSENWWPFLIYDNKTDYVEYLQEWFTRFQREQIRIYLYDDWQNSPLAVIQDIFRFLEVEESFIPNMSVRHNERRLPISRIVQTLIGKQSKIKTLLKPLLPQSLRSKIRMLNYKKPPPIDPELRRQLTEEHRDDILKLQDLIGRDLSHWLK